MRPVGALGAGGCAGVTGNLPPSSPAQLAQAAEDACAGVPAAMREKGLLAFREQLANAAPLSEDITVGKTKISHVRGETVTLRAAPEMTVPWLERINSCHVALTLSGQLPEVPADPFVVAGTTVRVEETYTGYLVTIHANSDGAAGDIARRANTMLAMSGRPVTAEVVDH